MSMTVTCTRTVTPTSALKQLSTHNITFYLAKVRTQARASAHARSSVQSGCSSAESVVTPCILVMMAQPTPSPPAPNSNDVSSVLEASRKRRLFQQDTTAADTATSSTPSPTPQPKGKKAKTQAKTVPRGSASTQGVSTKARLAVAKASRTVTDAGQFCDTVARLDEGAYDLAQLLLQPVVFRQALHQYLEKSHRGFTRPRRSILRLCMLILLDSPTPGSQEEAVAMLVSTRYLHKQIQALDASLRSRDGTPLVPSALFDVLCQQEVSNIPSNFSLYESMYRFALKYFSSRMLLRIAKRAGTKLMHKPLWRMARKCLVQRGSILLAQVPMYCGPEQSASMSDAEAVDVQMQQREEQRERSSSASDEGDDDEELASEESDDDDEEEEESETSADLSHRMDVVQHEMFAFFDRCTCNIEAEDVCLPEIAARGPTQLQSPSRPQTVPEVYAVYCEWIGTQGDLAPFSLASTQPWLEPNLRRLQKKHPDAVLRLPPADSHAWGTGLDDHGVDSHIFPHERGWYPVDRLAIASWPAGPAGPSSRLRLRRVK